MDPKADSGIVGSLCSRGSKRGRMMRIKKRNNIKKKVMEIRLCDAE